MKVQKQFVNKRGDKSYYKYVIVVPPENIQEAEFKEGDDLVAVVKKGSILLKKK